MTAPDRTHRLLRFDGRISINRLRAAFASWSDRLMAGTVLLIALAGARTWFAGLPESIARWAVVAIGFVLGIAVGRAARARLTFHAFDGVLGADALDPRLRRQYLAAWHSITIVILSAIALLVRAPLLIVMIPAYAAGALLAGLTGGVGLPLRSAGRARWDWGLRARLGDPSAGIAAAIVLLLALLWARSLGVTATLAFAGVGSLMLCWALTRVDPATVRFMTIAGYGSGRIVFRLARALTLFVALAVPGCWLILGAVAAGIVTAGFLVMALLLVLRVLAYRLHDTRFADVLVTVLAGGLLLIGYTLPVAVPLGVVVVLWHLERRARAKTWMLA